MSAAQRAVISVLGLRQAGQGRRTSAEPATCCSLVGCVSLTVDLLEWFPLWCALAPTVATQESAIPAGANRARLATGREGVCAKCLGDREHQRSAKAIDHPFRVSCCRGCFDCSVTSLCLALAVIVLSVSFASVDLMGRWRSAARIEDSFDSVFGAGMSAPARVTRGSLGRGNEGGGLVTIEGDTDYDVYCAQGYTQASRRMFQMEMQRRAGAGKLSAILGRATLDVDKAMRTWGFYAAAERAAATLPPNVTVQMQAFADGVNLYLSERHPLPMELQLVNAPRPGEWSVADSLVFAKLMALDLAGNAKAEADRMRAAFVRGLSPERVDRLMPTFPADGTRGFHTALSPSEIGLGHTDASATEDRHSAYDAAAADADVTDEGMPVGAPRSLGPLQPADLATGQFYTATGELQGTSASPRYVERSFSDDNYRSTLSLLNGVRARKGLGPVADQAPAAAAGRRASTAGSDQAPVEAKGASEEALESQRARLAGRLDPWLQRLLRLGGAEAESAQASSPAATISIADYVAMVGSAVFESAGSGPAPGPGLWLPRAVYKVAGLTAEYTDRGASNNWIVHGNLTDTGRPILANDPHLGFSAPSIWNLVHLRVRSTGYEAVGASFSGVPGVIIGRNNYGVAWGVTSTGADEQDLFVIDESSDGSSYHHAGRDLAFFARQEHIDIAGESGVSITVRETVHGPVLFPDNGAGAALMGGHLDGLNALGAPIALRWPAVSRGFDDRTAAAMFQMQRATSWSSFRSALSQWTTPSQNLVFAREGDGGGEIGYQMPGCLPIRPANYTGGFPSPGDGSADWQGVIPFSQMPRTYNPPKGYVVTANNRITPAPYLPSDNPYKYHITSDWDDPTGFRHADISESIERSAASGGHSVADSAATQSSVRSVGVARYIEPLQHLNLPRHCPGGISRRALDLLASLLAGAGLVPPEDLPRVQRDLAFGLSNAPNASLEMAVGRNEPALWGYFLAELLRLGAAELGSGAHAPGQKPFLLRVLQDTAVMESYQHAEPVWTAAGLAAPDASLYWGHTDPACTSRGHASCLGFICAAAEQAVQRAAPAAALSTLGVAASWSDSTVETRMSLLAQSPQWGGVPLGPETAQRAGAGTLHVQEIRHAVLGESPLACLANRYYARGGGFWTPNAASWSVEDPWMRNHAGAAFRGVFELPPSSEMSSRVVTTPGQSGNLFSEHYDDMAPLWSHGAYVAAPLAADAVAFEPEAR